MTNKVKLLKKLTALIGIFAFAVGMFSSLSASAVVDPGGGGGGTKKWVLTGCYTKDGVLHHYSNDCDSGSSNCNDNDCNNSV